MQKEFKVGDRVIKKEKGVETKGFVTRTDYIFPGSDPIIYPIWVDYDDDCGGESFTKDGRFRRMDEPILSHDEFVLSIFKKGQKVEFKPDRNMNGFYKNKTYTGTVSSVSVNEETLRFGYPVMVNFDNGKVGLFTNKGQYDKNHESVTLFTVSVKKQYLESSFKEGDIVIWHGSAYGEGYEGKIVSVATGDIPENMNKDVYMYPVLAKFRDVHRTFTHDGRVSADGIINLELKEIKHIPDLCNKENNYQNQEYDHVSAPHYRKSPVEAIDIFEKVYGAELTAMWCEITALKYRLRLGHKPTSPIEDDLKKEKWYLEKREELLKKVSKSVN